MTFSHSVKASGSLTSSRTSFLIYLGFEFVGAGRNIKLTAGWFACFSCATTRGGVAKRSPAGQQQHDLVAPGVKETITIKQAEKVVEFGSSGCGSYSFGELFRLVPPDTDTKIDFIDLAKWAPDYKPPVSNANSADPFRKQKVDFDGKAGMPFLYDLSPVHSAEGLASSLGVAGPFLANGFLKNLHTAGANVSWEASGTAHPSFTVDDNGVFAVDDKNKPIPVFVPGGGGSGEGRGSVVVLAGDFAPALSSEIDYSFWNDIFPTGSDSPDWAGERLGKYLSKNRAQRLSFGKDNKQTSYHPGYSLPCELYHVSNLDGIKTPRIGRMDP